MTAGAQTATNVSTAIANNTMGQVNQYGPGQSLVYTQRGTKKVTDPNTGETYDVPQYDATTRLTGKEWDAYDRGQDAKVNLADTAAQQSEFLQNYLKKPPTNEYLQNRMYIPEASKFVNQDGNANLDRRAASGGAVTSQGGQRGNLATNTGAQSNVIERGANGGNVQGQLAGAGNIQQNIESGGNITRSYGTDFSEDRQRVEDALMQRMQGGQDRDRAQLETRLANQGIGYGTAAYSAAMDDYNRSVNDSRLGAILAGGQEQSRITGLEAQRAGFQNSAQSQAYGQNANNAQFTNAAQAQRFGQNLASGDFANQAQQQRYGQDASNIQMQNAAQAQDFGQDISRAQFQNQAAGQNFSESLQNSQFANQAQQQRFGQDATNLQMQNAVRQASLDNTNSARGANNAIAGTLFGQNVQRAGMADDRRVAQMQEQFAYRNQPINEITALMSGSQVQAPNFSQYQPQGMPTVDYAGLVNQNYAQQQGNYQQQMAQRNGLVGGLFGLGAAGITGGLFG